jgi:hypothetical protein
VWHPPRPPWRPRPTAARGGRRASRPPASRAGPPQASPPLGSRYGYPGRNSAPTRGVARAGPRRPTATARPPLRGRSKPRGPTASRDRTDGRGSTRAAGWRRSRPPAPAGQARTSEPMRPCLRPPSSRARPASAARPRRRLPGPRLDLDPARPHRLGHLARQLDRQQPVLEPRVLHLDVVGELEAPLERAGRDAAVQVLRALLALLAPAHHQQVGLRRQLQLAGAKPATAMVIRYRSSPALSMS